MEKPVERIDDLIIQYHNGTIDPEGIEELLSWVEKDPGNKDYFKEQLNLLRSIQTPEVRFDAEKSLAEFNKRIRKKPLNPFVLKVAAIAAFLAFAIVAGKILSDRFASDSPVFNQYMAAETNLLHTLEDKTQVTLSKNSVLSVPEAFASDTRIVKLEGKAYFEVSEEPDRPFIVVCQNITIRVTGTSFEVETDIEKNSVRVAVTSGRVLVKSGTDGHEKPLQEDDQIVISQDGRILEESQEYDENLLAWKTGILTFNNIQMSEVAQTLSAFYGTTIAFEEKELENEFITLTIDNQTLAEVKATLEIILDATITESEGKLIIGKNH